MSELVVTVKQGKLRGSEVKGVTGGSYISFKGIPFATPPVGDLRFRDPKPPQSWTGVRDALAEGPKCGQIDLMTKQVIGDDDCLYLNVATKSLTGSRPVMVWVHGGAFMLGDGGSDTCGPDYIMDSGVVYVGFNYRVGVLGFLNLDHEVAPGNMGLKDQVAALKWVKENIAQFGGDADNITVFGESAGGASIHYLLLSPLAKGLFHKAIMQSGVVLNPWASVPLTVDMAHRFVTALGRDITDPKEIVEYLRTVPVHRLVEFQENLLNLQERIDLLFPFGPSVDDKSPEPFMPSNLEEIVEEGFDVPVIIGHNSHEGMLFLSTLFWPLIVQKQAYVTLRENFEKTLPRNLIKNAASKVSEIAKNVKQFYFGDKLITEDLVDESVQYLGDVHFVVGIQQVMEIQRKKKKSPTYFYRFSYDSPTSSSKALTNTQAKGVMHGDELQYLFVATKYYEMFKMYLGPKEEVVRDRFVRMWTDFAKTGNPTPITDDLITQKWEPVTDTTKNYLEIDEELSSGVNPNQDAWETWNRAYAMASEQ